MKPEDIFQKEPTGRSPLALDQGTLIRDQFRLGRVLGVGGFGITYLAFDEVLEMVVAVKEYLPSSIAVRDTGSQTVRPLSQQETSDFEFGLERFLREARMLAKFEEHPNIVRVRTYFEANGTGYLVMNYYEGRTLREYLEIRNDFILESEALLIMEQVLDGLAAVHEKGILHRDIDPSNVYLADNGKVVLLDFGAARAAVGERTQDMSVVLKPGYAPYEQYHSQGDQGPWTDVYACSATLYRALTGYKPPEATARFLEDELVPPVELVPSLSDATNEAVVEGLTLHPEDRPSSIEGLTQMLPETSSDDVPGWDVDRADEEGPSVGPDEATAELNVTVSHACRLYVDGTRRAEVGPDMTYTGTVTEGAHRLRAVRIDRRGADSATVTMSATATGGADTSADDLALDEVLWKDVITVSRNETALVTIDFDREASSDAVQDGASSNASRDDEPSLAPTASSRATPRKRSDSTHSASAADDDREDDRTGTLSFLQVRSDFACDLFVDGVPEETLDAGAEQWIAVRPGKHRVRAEAVGEPGVWEHEIKSEANRATTVAVELDRAPGARGRSAVLRSIPLKRLRTWLLKRPVQWIQDVFPGLSARQIRIGVLGGLALLLGSTLVLSAVMDGEAGLSNAEGPASKGVTAHPDRAVTQGETVVNVVANDVAPAGDVVAVQSARALSPGIQEVEVVDASRIRIRPAPDFRGTARVQYTVATATGTTTQSSVSVGVPFGQKRAVITRDADGPQAVRALPLTEDGRPDLVVASYDDNTVGWIDNRGEPTGSVARSGIFAAFQPLTDAVEGALAVQMADVSGNGRPDILFAAERGGTVGWCENQGGGVFGAPRILTGGAEGVISVHAADLTGDAQPDVVVGARRGRRVTWYRNEGQGDFSAPRTIEQGVNQLGAVHVADVTNDGYPEILVASFRDNVITWYENQGRTAPLQFTGPRLLSTKARGPISLHTADLTGDDREDVLVSAAEEGAIVWFKNQGSIERGTTFGPVRSLADDVRVIEDLATADLGDDGDEDVFAAAFDRNALILIENQPHGAFGPPRVIDRGIVDPVSIELTDVDGDGDLDVFSAAQGSDEVAWHENFLR